MTGARSRYAQQGQRERCARCGLLVELKIIAYTIEDEPVWRWVAIRKTRRAPRPVDCPGRGNKNYHRAEGYHVDGKPWEQVAS